MSPLFCIDPKCRRLLTWKHYNFSVCMTNDIRWRELFKKKCPYRIRNINTGSDILMPDSDLTGPLIVPKNLS